jgi:hypothetical protein
LAEQDFEPGFPSRSFPSKVVDYMGGDQSRITPIMTQHDNVFQSGPNAYSKPAAGLYMLREVILGHELFDKAFKTYAERWRFKHPTPADFFRTMEDASGTDLDWFWRGWFFTTDYNDIGIKGINQYRVTDQPTEQMKELVSRYELNMEDYAGNLYLEKIESTDEMGAQTPVQDITLLNEYLADNFSEKERESLKDTKYFYEIVFEKPGGLVMPILAEITYEDGTKENKYYPAEIWRFNDKEIKKVFASEKPIASIVIDPKKLTADVNLENNSWPREKAESKFEAFKKKNPTK